MATNLLSLPLLTVAFETATNESWRDSVAFTTAGSITAIPAPGNAGRGLFSELAISQGGYTGDYTLTLTDIGAFRISDPDGYTIGTGVIGVPFRSSGIAFLLDYGGAVFVTGDSYTLTVLPQPLDITGIRFVMQMRTATPSAQILVGGDTNDGTLVNGGTTGVLGLAIPKAVMASVPVSTTDSPHVLDIVGIADGDQRRCVAGTNAVVSGVTFPAN